MTYRNLNSNGAYTLQTGRGMLHTITISTKGSGSATIHVYDGTSDAGDLVCHVDVHTQQVSLTYDLQFERGLHVVLDGGNAPDVTVTYM